MIMSLVGDAFNAHIHSIQCLSNLLLNIVTDVELTTSCGKLFQILTTRRLKKFFRRSSRERWTDNFKLWPLVLRLPVWAKFKNWCTLNLGGTVFIGPPSIYPRPKINMKELCVVYVFLKLSYWYRRSVRLIVSFANYIVSILFNWNSLPNLIVAASTANVLKARLDKFWLHQTVKCDFKADLTGTGNR